MKIQCNRKALSDAVQLVVGALDPKATKPALRCVKLAAKDDSLTVSGTDLHIGMVVTVPSVLVEKAGVSVVAGEDLANILREMRDETVNCFVDGAVCVIEGKESRFRLPTENPEDFPQVPTFTGDPMVEISRGDLDVMIKRTVFAISMEATRYALNGVLFAAGKDALELVATDGRRLAHIKRAAKCSERMDGVIVPVKGVQEAAKMLTDGLEMVGIRVGKANESAGARSGSADLTGREEDARRIFVRAGNASMFAQLVEGQFPNYKEVIPTGNPIKVLFNSEELLAAVTQASLVTSPDTAAVRMHFDKDTVQFSSHSAEHGEAKIEVKVKYDHSPLDIGFDPRFLLDMLRAVGTAEVQLEMKDSDSPAVFRVGEDYVYVVMPISLRED